MNKNFSRLTLVTIASALLMTGCETLGGGNKRTQIGTAIGAITGAVLGKRIGSKDRKSTMIGGVLGAIAGGAVGNYMDKQQKALEERLAKERAAKQVGVTRTAQDELRLDIDSNASFAVGQAALQPRITTALAKITGVLSEYPQTIIHIVGHTDSQGTANYNQQLSERRAASVAGYFINQGVNRDRLLTSGRGEQQPRADNATTEGRSLNRRVDVYLKPIIKGNEQQALVPPQ